MWSDEKPPRILLVRCAPEPAGQRLMPAQVVSPHPLACQSGKTHETIGLGKVEAVRRGPQRLPLHGIFRHQDARLRSHSVRIRVSRVALRHSLHIQQSRIHCRAVEQPSRRRVRLKRIRPSHSRLHCGVILPLPPPSRFFDCGPSQAQRAGRPNAQRRPAKLSARELRLTRIRHVVLLRSSCSCARLTPASAPRAPVSRSR